MARKIEMYLRLSPRRRNSLSSLPPTPYKRLCVRLLTLVQLALFNWKRRPLGPLMIYPSIELNTCRSYKTSRRVLLLLVDPGRRRNRIDHWSLLVEEILLLQ